MPYTFEAGPDEDRYAVETPWSADGVSKALATMRTRLPWLTRETLHGSMLMLLSGFSFDDVTLDPMDGTGNSITLGEMRSCLDHCN